MLKFTEIRGKCRDLQYAKKASLGRVKNTEVVNYTCIDSQNVCTSSRKNVYTIRAVWRQIKLGYLYIEKS